MERQGRKTPTSCTCSHVYTLLLSPWFLLSLHKHTDFYLFSYAQSHSSPLPPCCLSHTCSCILPCPALSLTCPEPLSNFLCCAQPEAHSCLSLSV